MPILGILLVALQIFFVVHAIRNGKETYWLWIIMLAPGIGCAAYFLTQFAPDAGNSHSARRVRKQFIKAVDPKRELRKRMDMLETSNTVENRVALADECIEEKMYAEAIDLLHRSLVGLHATDPAIMERLARAQFEHGEPDKAAQTLEALIASNPQHKSPDGHLLYARALAEMGRTEDAIAEYEVLRTSFPGEEARVRYGLLLRRIGEARKAAELFKESLLRARRAPRHYRNREQEWLRVAERGG